MKKIKLPYCSCKTVNTPQAREIIAVLTEQINAPEPVEFWDGQLCEFSCSADFSLSTIGRFLRYADGPYPYMRNGGYTSKYCRPLQDPLILQFKAHKPGDPMPCDGRLSIRYMTQDGYVGMDTASVISWHKIDNRASIIGWMPADGWGRSE